LGSFTGTDRRAAPGGNCRCTAHDRGQKLPAGGDLFDSACQVTLSGIRREHPGIDPVRALEMLRQRLE
jgi:hypothetical protein